LGKGLRSKMAVENIAYGTTLRTVMANRGIKGKELASYLGVHEVTVMKWLKGRAEPPRPYLLAIDEYLDLDLTRILYPARLQK
jgi:transcriptional regulator with XRE-family HTH domain